MKKIICLLLSCFFLLSGCGMSDGPTLREEENIKGEEDEIIFLLKDMTIEEKVGQMFIARCPDVNAREKAAEYGLGGYILFGRDFQNSSPDGIRATIDGYQSAVEIPMFIAVDEEGGVVNRVSYYKNFRAEPFMSPQKLYEKGGIDALVSDAWEKSQFLLDLGINVNFAPVCDVSQNSLDFIYSRTLGRGAEETARYIRAVVEVMDDAKIGSVLKHFPGYGNNEDTHTGIAHDKRPYSTFLEEDFVPFEAGIKANAGMVLVSHNVVHCMDEERPASISPAVHEILRENLGFQKIIITDDLVMQGISQYAGDEDAAVLAVLAGNDMLCSTNFEAQIKAVVEAVREKKISEDRIDESVIRILRYKQELALI